MTFDCTTKCSQFVSHCPSTHSSILDCTIRPSLGSVPNNLSCKPLSRILPDVYIYVSEVTAIRSEYPWEAVSKAHAHSPLREVERTMCQFRVGFTMRSDYDAARQTFSKWLPRCATAVYSYLPWCLYLQHTEVETTWPPFCRLYFHMGQVTKLRLSCYLVLLSIDSKTR